MTTARRSITGFTFPGGKFLQLFAVLAVAGVTFGCAESQRPEASGKGAIRGIHAAPTVAEVSFLIEERALGTLSYKGSTNTQQFDDLSYNFHFDSRTPGQTGLTRLASESLDVSPEMDYVFVLTGTLASPSILLWETAQRQWEGTETTVEVSAGHLSPGLGDIDVYFAESGTAPAAGNARGTLAFGERLPPFETESGVYRLTITQAGNPAAVLFRSTPRDYNERTSTLFTVQDADPSITSNLSVRRYDQNGNSAEVGDTSFPPTRRFFNAALGSGSMDVYVGDEFATPIVSDLAFGTVSGDVEVPAGESEYTYTAAGNPGAILAEDEDTVAPNTRGTNFVIGEPDDLDVAVFPDDRRPITSFSKVRVVQAAIGFEQVDIYLLPPGTDIADRPPNLPRVPTGNSSNYVQLEPGSYEITVTKTGEKTILAGPLALSLASGDIVESVMLDTADPNVLTLSTY
ncbi:MAG TPA: DUF4397 domain-containing protein [Woeseiaceae bacterium]|nr:DUF4397 domain-containing protein [Woeseiaceae bacterium]